MSKISDDVVSIMVAIIGVATLAVIVSKRSATASVITSAGNAFSQALKTVVTPVS
jgi:hypothetical protein